MTGVQTCALPICFPVTIQTGGIGGKGGSCLLDGERVAVAYFTSATGGIVQQLEADSTTTFNGVAKNNASAGATIQVYA